MKYSTLGYKENSPDRNEKTLFIPSSKITMKGVNRRLTLIPVINGKPNFDKKVIANPGDPDFDFGDVDGVLEIPNSLDGGYPLSMNKYLNNLPEQPIQNISNSMLPNSPIPNQNQIGQGVLDTSLNFKGIGGTKSEYDAKMGIESKIDNSIYEDSEVFKNSPLSPNEVQKQENKNKGFTGAVNPYGGFNINNASSYLGASIENGNAKGIVTSGLKVGLGLARNILSGIGATRRFNQAITEQEEKMKAEADKRDTVYAQKGGLLLTGNAIVGNDNHPNPNSEIERGEYVQTPDGQVAEVLGKKHSEGGELIDAPDGTKVVSDYVKIGAPLAKMFKKEYGLNVVAGSTFATVIDRYKKKIGLNEVLDEEVSLINKMTAQDEIKNETVRDLNLEVISKKLQEVEGKKKPLDEKMTEFTNLVFERQEAKKQIDDSKFKKQEGGEISGIESLLQNYAQLTNTSVEEIVASLQQLTEEEVKQALQQMSEAVGGSQTQMQEGGEIGDPTQIVQAYAEANQIPFEDLMTQLQGLGEEELQQALQQMTSELQGGGQEDLEQVIMAYAEFTNTSPEEITTALSELSEDELEQAVQQMITEMQQ